MSGTASNAANNSTAAQTGPNATSSSTGTTSPLAAVPAQPTARTNATAATKKTPSAPAIVSSSPAVAVGSSHAQHGKSSSASPVNGKNQISPAVPSVGNPAIATSNNLPNGDHRKQSSVTIGGNGAHMGNGGPVASNSRPAMVFGSMPQGGASPAPAHSTPNHSHASSLHAPLVNPRVTSPSASPSPIPQPAASGGRPSLGLQGQSNVPTFGSINDNSNSGTPLQGPGTPNLPPPQHLRRESSQSAHSDMSGVNMNMNRGYPGGAGRGGRGFSNSYNQPPMGSPTPAFRQLHNAGPRGGHNMANFQGQGPRTAYMNSPAQAPRSPAMNAAGIAQQAQYANGPSYGGYAPYQPQYQQPGFYGAVPAEYPYGYYGQPPFAQNMQFHQPHAPPSPRPFNATHGAQQFVPPYAPHAQSMSRTPSHSSERPSSSFGLPQGPAIASSTPSQPKAPTPAPTAFEKPKKSSKIVIKDASGQVVDLEKAAASSAPPKPTAPQGPVIASSSTPTPPPRTPSASHNRTESKVNSTDATKTKSEFQEKVRAQLEAEHKKKEEEAKLVKEKEEADAKAAKEKEEAEAKAAKEKADAEKAKADEEEKKRKEAEEAERLKKEEDERLEREIAEMEALEREEEERERKYQEKKKKDAEEAKKREAEALAKQEEELKRLEKEAEEAEKSRETAKEASAEDKALFASLKKPTFGPGASQTEESGASTPASDTSAAIPPSLPTPKFGTKKPSTLKLETSKAVEPPQPTAGMQSLKSARFLEIRDGEVKYPTGIASPRIAVNHGGRSRGSRYDEDFLMQFADVFKEKPSLDWDQKIKETIGDGDSARPQSARTPSMGRPATRPGMAPSGLSTGVMGGFQATGRTLPPGTTSQERFMASQGQGRTAMQNPFASFAGRPGGFGMGGSGMVRSGSSQSLAHGSGLNSPRVGTSRGKGGSRRGDKTGTHEEVAKAKTMPLTAGQELKPLEQSKSGWKPMSVAVGSAGIAVPAGHLTPDIVQRKVKSALNKMTPEKFDKIADQILEIAGQSKAESDGRTLRQIIQLTFEKACDEAHWASMYAKFCHRMLTTMSLDIKDENIRDKNGQVVTGGNLFRKYLLNRCQEEFERGWTVNLPPKAEGQTEEAAMMSEEYYIAATIKRRGLGLVQFIGELYKLGMLTTRIMHECAHKLLNFEGLPDESTIESLTKLLRTVGATMEKDEKGQPMIAAYFDRIDNIMKMEALPSRLRFMLLDVIDLRRAGWRSKDDAKGPKTIQEIHQEAQAAHAQAEIERQRSNQRGPGGRPPIGRGDARSFSGNMPPQDFPRNQLGMDDLRKLNQKAGGNRQFSSGPSTLGPSSLFGSRSSSGRKNLGPLAGRSGDESGASSRTGTPPVKDKETNSSASANAFSALASLDGEENNEVASPPSEKTSPAVNKSQTDAGKSAGGN